MLRLKEEKTSTMKAKINKNSDGSSESRTITSNKHKCSNEMRAYKRRNRNCDFLNFVTIIFAMCLFVNVQLSSGLIEIQNEKEKHGKRKNKTSFLFLFE